MQVRLSIISMSACYVFPSLRLPCNSKKNRYRDVGCLDHNRVKLNKVQGKEVSDVMCLCTQYTCNDNYIVYPDTKFVLYYNMCLSFQYVVCV